MCEQNTLSKLYGNLLQTSSLWHRADRGTTRSARDPSSHTPAGAPQDDNVFLAGGFAPCTPIRDCEHRCLTIIVQFDILFFHIQVCQQSESAPKRGFLPSFCRRQTIIRRKPIIILAKQDHHSREARSSFSRSEINTLFVHQKHTPTYAHPQTPAPLLRVCRSLSS